VQQVIVYGTLGLPEVEAICSLQPDRRKTIRRPRGFSFCFDCASPHCPLWTFWQYGARL